MDLYCITSEAYPCSHHCAPSCTTAITAAVAITSIAP